MSVEERKLKKEGRLEEKQIRLQKQEERKLQKEQKYETFKKITREKINKIRKIVYLKYNQGFRLGCFTASSKGNTLLNCLNLKEKIIRFTSENNTC